MRSKASCKGHPIHPAPIPFPFAVLYGAFFFDLAGRLAQRPSWWTTGGYLSLVGVIAAVHRMLLGRQVVIVEGLDLSQVPAGNYDLLCLPLRLAGLDGAPARAVLIG
jgi:kynurenine formamidase